VSPSSQVAGATRPCCTAPSACGRYNITTTGLSVAVALLIGTIEIVQVLSRKLGWHGPVFDFLNQRIDFGVLGYLIVGMFLAAWLGSVVLWKLRRVEERYGDRLAEAEA
jgi:nickel/cobalt transporter (NiCoT) family protein